MTQYRGSVASNNGRLAGVAEASDARCWVNAEARRRIRCFCPRKEELVSAGGVSADEHAQPMASQGGRCAQSSWRGDAGSRREVQHVQLIAGGVAVGERSRLMGATRSGTGERRERTRKRRRRRRRETGRAGVAGGPFACADSRLDGRNAAPPISLAALG